MQRKFDRFMDRYWDEFYEHYPEWEVWMGMENPEGKQRLNRYRKKDSEERTDFLARACSKVAEIPAARLTPDEKIDLAILKGSLMVDALTLDADERFMDPTIYVSGINHIDAIITLGLLDPIGDAVTDLLDQLVLVYQDGMRNLQKSCNDCPKEWVIGAIETLRFSKEFLSQIPENRKVLSTSSKKQGLYDSVEKALRYTGRFERFLKSHVLPLAEGTFAHGEEQFYSWLKHQQFIDYSIDDLKLFSQSVIDETLDEMRAISSRYGMTIRDFLQHTMDDQPKGDMIKATQKAAEIIRSFIDNAGFVSLPLTEMLHVTPTPGYLKHYYSVAAYMPPACFDARQRGIYFLTKSTNDMPNPEFNRYTMDLLLAHEAYPGHHLQLSLANEATAGLGDTRAQLPSTQFCEGWALYCEQLMEEQGLLDTDEHRMWVLDYRLLRATRVQLEIGLQTEDMTYKKAVERLHKDCFLDIHTAKSEISWYIQNPGYPMSYLIGWKLINDLRADEQRRLDGSFNLREFHDKLLGQGTIPIPLIKEHVFGYSRAESRR